MQDQLIVALDFPTEAKAKETVLALGETVGYYKVGLELFLNSGGRIIEFLQEKRKKIFLDLNARKTIWYFLMMGKKDLSMSFCMS